jgi:hypothetical protein
MKYIVNSDNNIVFGPEYTDEELGLLFNKYEEISNGEFKLVDCGPLISPEDLGMIIRYLITELRNQRGGCSWL